MVRMPCLGRQAEVRGHTAWLPLLTLIVLILILTPALFATENGGSVYPVGVETVMTGMQPHPGKTMIYQYTCYYAANEFDGSDGKSSLPEFKLRVFAAAVKVTHNWGWRFLGGTVDSQIGIPLLYEQLHVPPGKFTVFAVGNIDLIPLSVTGAKGNFHYYYEADIFAPGPSYSETAALNIGQHNWALAPVAGFTYLGDKGKTEISSRLTYIFNTPNKATEYHSGNEFMWEYNVDREFGHVALGLNGYVYKQTTDDAIGHVRYLDGVRGRNFAIGPQIRFPLGKHGGFAFKYYRDTLVQNHPRGNAFWFQIAVPI